MAKKNDTFSYGAAAIPSGETKYSVIRWGWNGLNRSDKIDTGVITDCSGVIIDPPYVLPTITPKNLCHYAEPISVFGFGKNLLVVYRDGGSIKVDYRLPDGTVYSGSLGAAHGDETDFVERTAVQFNVATNTKNIIEAEFDRKILIFPDAYSMPFVPASDFTPAYLGDTYPKLKYASVYGSRVFGVDDNLVYASAYNDYADWKLDTATDFSTGNAWVSMSQANVRADGAFTAISSHDNHVVLFKKDFMQLVYGDENPFRIIDVGSYGCDNPYAVAEMNGILYFASSDALYRYAGSTPRNISDELELDSLRGAAVGAYNGSVYLSLGEELFVCKDGVWSSLGVQDSPIKQFATLDYGISALRKNGDIDLLEWNASDLAEILGSVDEAVPEYAGDWWFETDFMALGKLDVRRVKKVSLLCDLADGASASVYLLRDGDAFDANTSVKVGEVTGGGLKMLRVLTRQFSAYMHRLRICGSGYAKIYAAELKISWGGDVYVEG